MTLCAAAADAAVFSPWRWWASWACWAPSPWSTTLLGSAGVLVTVIAAVVAMRVTPEKSGRGSCLATSATSAAWNAIRSLLCATIPRQKRRCRVLLLGLDGAGKTALCQSLAGRKSWPSRQPRPEHHVLHYEFRLHGCFFDLVDPSYEDGDRRARCLALWEDLLRSCPDAIMFVVDAADAARLPEARRTLHWVLQLQPVQDLPVLVLGNKVDLRDAFGAWDLTRSLGLAGLSKDQREALLGRAAARRDGGLPHALRRRIASFHLDEAGSPPHGGPLAVRMCSVSKRWSVDAGVRWLLTEGGVGDAAAVSKELGAWCCRCWSRRSGHASWPVLLGSGPIGGACRRWLGGGCCAAGDLLRRQAALLPLYQA